MIIKTLLRGLFLVLILSENKLENIFEGKSGIQYIYYDSNKEDIIVELGYRYFGYHDKLFRKSSNGDTIAESNIGRLYKKNNELFYLNKSFNIKSKLQNKKYSTKIDNRRKNIFWILAEGEVHMLLDSLKIENFLFDSIIAQDIEYAYEYYRDQPKLPNNYKPAYIINLLDNLK
jgi:hypothetical protein